LLRHYRGDELKRFMEEKGISPVIATILLIATTAVAAGVIAAYVAGLYVSPGTIIAGSADGAVYDRDNDAGEEYTNGSLKLVANLTQGRMRDVDDTAYGFNILLSNARTGWSVSLSLDNKDSGPSPGYSGTIIFKGDANDNAADGNEITVYLPVNSDHRWVSGSACIIIIDNLAPEGPNATAVANPYWDEQDTIDMVFSGRDSLSLTGFSGAYLFGTRID